MSAAEGDIVAHLALIEPAGPTREGAGWLLNWLVFELAGC